jgi:flagellar hook-length control protein FliK
VREVASQLGIFQSRHAGHGVRSQVAAAGLASASSPFAQLLDGTSERVPPPAKTLHTRAQSSPAADASGGETRAGTIARQQAAAAGAPPAAEAPASDPQSADPKAAPAIPPADAETSDTQAAAQAAALAAIEDEKSAAGEETPAGAAAKVAAVPASTGDPAPQSPVAALPDAVPVLPPPPIDSGDQSASPDSSAPTPLTAQKQAMKAAAATPDLVPAAGPDDAANAKKGSTPAAPENETDPTPSPAPADSAKRPVAETSLPSAPQAQRDPAQNSGAETSPKVPPNPNPPQLPAGVRADRAASAATDQAEAAPEGERKAGERVQDNAGAATAASEAPQKPRARPGAAIDLRNDDVAAAARPATADASAAVNVPQSREPFGNTPAASGPAAPSTPAHAPADAALVPVAGLAVEIAARAQAGRNRFEIRLDPPELGRIDVRLDVDSSGNVTSRLVVERADTLEVLRRNAPELQRALQDAGLKTSDNGLQFTLRDQNFAGRRDRDAPTPAARLIVPDADAGVATETAPDYGYSRNRTRSRGLDIRV